MKKFLLVGVLLGAVVVLANPASGAKQKPAKAVDLQMESPGFNQLYIKATSSSSKCVKNRRVEGTFTPTGSSEGIPTDIKLDAKGERLTGSSGGTYEGQLPKKTIKGVKCKASPVVSQEIDGG